VSANGTEWRFLAQAEHGELSLSSTDEPGYIFDELVVDDWLHIEQMDKYSWWIRVGEVVVRVRRGIVTSIEYDL